MQRLSRWTYVRPGFPLEVCPNPIIAHRPSPYFRGKREVLRLRQDMETREYLPEDQLEKEIVRANFPSLSRK